MSLCNISFHGNQIIWGFRQIYWYIDMEYDLFYREKAILYFLSNVFLHDLPLK